MAGPLPLSYSEIKAWADLTGSEPDAFEVSVLKKIDHIFLTNQGKKS